MDIKPENLISLLQQHKPLPQAQVPKQLVATGDGAGWLAASSIALVVLAAAAIVVAAKRRRSRG